MPRFALKAGGKATLAVLDNGTRHEFALPLTTDDPQEVAILAAHPLVAQMTKETPARKAEEPKPEKGGSA